MHVLLPHCQFTVHLFMFLSDVLPFDVIPSYDL